MQDFLSSLFHIFLVISRLRFFPIIAVQEFNFGNCPAPLRNITVHPLLTNMCEGLKTKRNLSHQPWFLAKVWIHGTLPTMTRSRLKFNTMTLRHIHVTVLRSDRCSKCGWFEPSTRFHLQIISPKRSAVHLKYT